MAKKKVVAVYLETPLWNKLNAAAEKERRSLTAMMAHIAEEYLAGKEPSDSQNGNRA